VNPRTVPTRRVVLRGLVFGGPWIAAAGVCAQPVGAPAAAAAAAPGGASSGPAIAQLREFLQGTRSARGSFTQRTLRSAGPPETASGVFAFQRPGRFRWEVRKPWDQLLVADGEKLHFLDRDLNQVTVRRLAEAGAASPAALLFGSGDLERGFALREEGARDGLDWVLARPRSREAGFERILIGLRGGLPETMEVLDAFGRTTVFVFSGLERNPRLDPELFRFTAPRGADIIEQ